MPGMGQCFTRINDFILYLRAQADGNFRKHSLFYPSTWTMSPPDFRESQIYLVATEVPFRAPHMPQLERLDIEELQLLPEENSRGDGSIAKAPRGNTSTNASRSSPSL